MSEQTPMTEREFVQAVRKKIEAGEQVGRARYLRAAELLLEAESHFPSDPRGFGRWFSGQGFAWSLTQARRWMDTARTALVAEGLERRRSSGGAKGSP